MNSTRYEDLYLEDLRRAERLMLFDALRQRRARTGRRTLLGILVGLLGLRG